MDNTGPGTTAIHLVAGGTKCFRVFSQVVLTSTAMKMAKRAGDCIDSRFQRDLFTVCSPFATIKLGIASRMTAQAGIARFVLAFNQVDQSLLMVGLVPLLVSHLLGMAGKTLFLEGIVLPDLIFVCGNGRYLMNCNNANQHQAKCP